MARITITAVEQETKNRVKAAAARSGRMMSEMLKTHIDSIIAQEMGEIPTYTELQAQVAGLTTVVELYQRRQYREAEAKLAEVMGNGRRASNG